jgi:hypothetical protein
MINGCFPVISPGYLRPSSGGTHNLVKRFKNSICQVHTIVIMQDRTRLFRLLKNYSVLCREFLSSESVMGKIDSFGIELIHPFREGRRTNV